MVFLTVPLLLDTLTLSLRLLSIASDKEILDLKWFREIVQQKSAFATGAEISNFLAKITERRAQAKKSTNFPAAQTLKIPGVDPPIAEQKALVDELSVLAALTTSRSLSACTLSVHSKEFFDALGTIKLGLATTLCGRRFYGPVVSPAEPKWATGTTLQYDEEGLPSVITASASRQRGEKKPQRYVKRKQTPSPCDDVIVERAGAELGSISTRIVRRTVLKVGPISVRFVSEPATLLQTSFRDQTGAIVATFFKGWQHVRKKAESLNQD